MSDFNKLHEAIENNISEEGHNTTPEISWERGDEGQAIHDLIMVLEDKFGIIFEPAEDNDDERGYFHYRILSPEELDDRG